MARKAEEWAERRRLAMQSSSASWPPKASLGAGYTASVQEDGACLLGTSGLNGIWLSPDQMRALIPWAQEWYGE